jgi:hypothetical protein
MRQTVPGRAGPTVPYGLRQEEQLKRGLAREFAVIASADLDYLQKLDCVVRDRLHPELPPVGIQVTLRTHDNEKMVATLAVLRRTRAVSRAVYLIVETEIGETAFPPLIQLLHEAAGMDREAMLVAHLRDGVHGRRLDVTTMFPLATDGPAEAIQ